ncbi:MAG: hypothetical protein JOZ24_11135 [Candidatus Eremiobacteraeota bacterium]|nr:hypothetical protein [Candidatus Eremiobacteraeota bacterium]
MTPTLAEAPLEIVTPQSVAEIPNAVAGTIDVAILDMNHGHTNLGHDAIVGTVERIAGELGEELAARGRRVRVVSLPVRDRHVVPPPGRFGLLIGTGGPGHIDPRRNRTQAEGTIVEDAAWEAPFFALMDAIRDDGETAVIAICHTYGVLCRWAKIAEPVLRDAVLGGRSIGINCTALTDRALAHPWFAPMVAELRGATRFPVVDSRYYDLVPTGELPAGTTALGFESDERGERRRALTMVEFARRADDTAPRILGVNHHPEVVSADALEAALQRGRAAGEISDEVYRSRSAIITELRRPGHDETARSVGSAYTFTRLVRHHLERMIAA